jgi:hypothetical protein
MSGVQGGEKPHTQQDELFWRVSGVENWRKVVQKVAQGYQLPNGVGFIEKSLRNQQFYFLH